MHANMPLASTVLNEIRSAKCRTIATYSSFTDAQNALDYLIDHGFKEQSLAIVLKEVQPQETAPPNPNWLFSSGQSALNGGVVGLGISFLTLMVSMWTPSDKASVDLAFSGVAYGALAGAVIGVLGWIFTEQKPQEHLKGFAASAQYNVIAQSNDATRAQEVLFTFMESAARV